MTGTLLPSFAFAEEGAPGGDSGTKYEQDVQAILDAVGTQSEKGAAQQEAKAVTDKIATDFPSTDAVAKEYQQKDGSTITGMKYYDGTGLNAYGVRETGSLAEHQCAQWLAGEMASIGLTPAGQDGYLDTVDVDGWEYLGAKFEMDGMTMEDPIISYMSTYQGTIEDAEIVYLGDATGALTPEDEGSGYVSWYNDYYDAHNLTGADRNMNGKIVVADINQDDSWITPFYMEAARQGAEGIITYSYQFCDYESGVQTGTYWDHAVQIQDVCAEDKGIACVAVSRADGLKIKKLIADAAKDGETPTATLQVDSKVTLEGESAAADAAGLAPNKAWNVVGKIPGTKNTGKQIVLAGHYDKYWYGYNDDCAAIGTIFGAAKALIDSGYQPANDIYIICHAAEEWGQSGVENDWAIGSWKEIVDVHPEWQGTTLGMINFELPTMTPESRFAGGVEFDGKNEIGTGCSVSRENWPVYESFKAAAMDSIWDSVEESTGKEMKALYENKKAMVLSDELGWEFKGVPTYTLRGLTGEFNPFTIYHTHFDSEANYQDEAMEYVLKATASLAAYIDQQPVVEMDGEWNAAQLRTSIDAMAENGVAEAAGINVEDYNAAIDSYVNEFELYQKAAKTVNNAYAEKLNAGLDAEADQIYADAQELYRIGMDAYRTYQDEVPVVGGSDLIIRSKDFYNNYIGVKLAAKALADKNAAGMYYAALGYTSPAGINWGNSAMALSCTPDVAVDYTYVADSSKVNERLGTECNRTWGHEVCQARDFVSVFYPAYLYCKYDVGSEADAADMLETINAEAETLKTGMKDAAEREITALNTIAEKLENMPAKDKLPVVEETLAETKEELDQAKEELAAKEEELADAQKELKDTQKSKEATQEELDKARANEQELAEQVAAEKKRVAQLQETVFKLTPVKGLKVKNVKIKKAKLSWTKNSKAVKYQVYYKIKTSKKWKSKTVKTTKTTISKLRKGKTYQFKVRAINKNGTKSKWSAVKKITIKR